MQKKQKETIEFLKNSLDANLLPIFLGSIYLQAEDVMVREFALYILLSFCRTPTSATLKRHCRHSGWDAPRLMHQG